jgi:hypothetical protein
MTLVTRREWVWMVVTAVALVTMDAADRDTSELFEIGDDGSEGVAIIWVAVQCFGVQHELPAFLGSDRRCN